MILYSFCFLLNLSPWVPLVGVGSSGPPPGSAVRERHHVGTPRSKAAQEYSRGGAAQHVQESRAGTPRSTCKI